MVLLAMHENCNARHREQPDKDLIGSYLQIAEQITLIYIKAAASLACHFT